MSKSKDKTTVLTSLNGNTVNIKVKDNTNLKGALISSTKEDGVNIDTNTLSTSNLSNRKSSRNISLGGSIGTTGSQKDKDGKDIKGSNKLTTVSGNLAIGNQNSKSKTLATITSGNIKIRDKKNSTKLSKLNRNKDDVNLDLYDVKSDVKVSVEVDIRLLTKDGQMQIKEDLTKTKFILDSINEVATEKSSSLIKNTANGETGIFQNIADKVFLFDASKKFANDPKNQKASPEDMKQAANQLNAYLAKEMGLKPSEIKIMLDKQYKGATSSETKKAYIAGNLIDNMGGFVNSVHNENSYLADLQRDTGVEKTDNYVGNRVVYSKNFGNLGQKLLEAQNGYSINNTRYNKVGTNLSKIDELSKNVIVNTQKFNKLDKSKIAHRQLKSSEIEFLQSEKNVRKYLLSKNNNANPSQEDIQGARHELTQTAIALVYNNWKKILGNTVNQEAEEFLNSNISSVKNVTEIEKANSAQGVKEIANNKENLDFYKDNIFSGAKKDIKTIVDEKSTTAINGIFKTIDVLNVVEDMK